MVLAHERGLPCAILRPEGQTNPLAIRFPTHGGIRTRGNGELNPIEQDLGVSLDPLDCPVQAAPGIRFGRASRTAVIPYTRAVGVLQVYFTILWGGIHGKKAANLRKPLKIPPKRRRIIRGFPQNFAVFLS